MHKSDGSGVRTMWRFGITGAIGIVPLMISKFFLSWFGAIGDRYK